MRLVILLLLLCLPATAAEDEGFRVYSEHPRLFLGQHRLKLLRKEPSRQSMRWEQFSTLMKGGVQPPEPGFAWALYYEITQEKKAGRKAVDWAIAPARGKQDLRQLALVFDWCQEILTPAESESLAGRIRSLLQPSADSSLSAERDRILAAISIAEVDQNLAEKVLKDAVTRWWRSTYITSIDTSRGLPIGEEVFPLVEILHAVRDNLNIDLRESKPAFFSQLPEFHVSVHYPAPYPAAENEYRIPAFFHKGDPNLESAALSRAAGLALVAYDTNSIPTQFLQGWLIQDRFLMRGPFGSPYEFLWANPYQPGLAYVHLPLVFHDVDGGTLLARSSWEENAVWFGLIRGQMQLFENGTVTEIKGGSGQGSIDLGPTRIMQGKPPMKFPVEEETVFVIGLKPSSTYDLETDGEEMREVTTDPAGTVEIKFAKDRKTKARLHAVMAPHS